ncbi:MAG: leucine-rich repeat domain-containing protein [Ruminococcus sp.]|nr:leucine-rich repeat domain-containing protein [Ruminococcus sp.]
MKKIVAALMLSALAAAPMCACSSNNTQTVSIQEATEPEYRDEQGVGYNTLEDGSLTTVVAKKTILNAKISSEYEGKKVTTIGRSTFKMADIVSVEIEEGITKIDDYAFAFCRNLTGIEIPDGVTVIGTNAFSGCTKLEKIALPSTLEEIGMFSFDAVAAEKIDIPESVKKIDEYAFAQCGNLAEITIHSKDIEIAETAFEQCTNLKIIAPKNSTSIKLAQNKGIDFEEAK